MKIDILTASITTDAEPLVLELLDRIGRARALHDDESLLVEKIVRRSTRGSRTLHKWTAEEDRELRRIQYRRRGVAEFAQRIGVSEAAAWSRLQALRYPHKRRARPIEIEG